MEQDWINIGLCWACLCKIQNALMLSRKFSVTCTWRTLMLMVHTVQPHETCAALRSIIWSWLMIWKPWLMIREPWFFKINNVKTLTLIVYAEDFISHNAHFWVGSSSHILSHSSAGWAECKLHPPGTTRGLLSSAFLRETWDLVGKNKSSGIEETWIWVPHSSSSLCSVFPSVSTL